MSYPESSSPTQAGGQVRLQALYDEIIDSIEREHREGRRRFIISVPTIAGKQVLGTRIMQKFEWKTIILSPNLAVQSHWYDKSAPDRSLLVETASGVWGKNTGHVVSSLPYSCAPALLLTYMRSSVTHMDPAANEIERFARHLAKHNYRMMIIDAGYAFSPFWENALKQISSRIDITILGFSTLGLSPNDIPPHFHSEVFASAARLSVPSVIVAREGFFAPYQHLIHFTSPADEEKRRLSELHDDFHCLRKELLSPNIEIHTLEFWCSYLASKAGEISGSPPLPANIYANKQAITVALARFLRSNGSPSQIPVPPEYSPDEEPTLDDYVILLKTYARGYLDNHPSEEAVNRRKKIESFLETIEPHRNNPSFLEESRFSLIKSKSKIQGAIDVIKMERENLGDHVRVIVLIDDNHEEGSGNDESPVGSGISGNNVLEAITNNPDTDPLHPLFLTGSTILCNDSLVIPVLSEAQKLIKQYAWDLRLTHMNHGLFSEIFATGPDWNSHTYVVLVCELFRRGVTRCLIGDKRLFGIGWEVCSVNTVIDLASSPGNLIFNHYRQPIRPSIEMPWRIAHYWDIAAISPEYICGYDDWERVVRKHSQTEGPADDSVIEQGIGYIHPMLTNTKRDDFRQTLEKLNAEMNRLSREREKTYKRWKIGESISRDTIWCAEITSEETGNRTYISEILQRKALERDLSEYHDRIHSQRIHYALAGVVSAGAIMSAFLLLPLLYGSALALLIGTVCLLSIFSHWMKTRRMKSRNVTIPAHRFIELLSTALLEAIHSLNGITNSPADSKVEILTRGDNSYRIFPFSVDEECSRLFSTSLIEMFQPVETQRYFVQLYCLDHSSHSLRAVSQLSDFNALYKPAEIIPVPARFSHDPDSVEVFVDALQRNVGKAQLICADQENGAQYIRNFLNRELLPSRQNLGRMRRENS